MLNGFHQIGGCFDAINIYKEGQWLTPEGHLTIQVVGPIFPHSLGLVDSFQRGNSESSAEVEDSDWYP